MEWFERWFGEEYLLVYEHRDTEEAEREAATIRAVLDLKEEELVLDLCCGSGRHDRPLSQYGCRVVGLDYSRELLNKAAAAKLPENRYPLYVRADARTSVFSEGAFDAVLNLFTSFGYFNDDENRALICEIGRLLRHGGRYYIDYLNPPRVLKNLVNESTAIKNGITVTERRRYDAKTCRIEKTITLEGEGPVQEFHESVRLYGCGELMSMMKDAGLTIDGVLGSIEGEIYDDSSPRMILYGKKK